MSDHISALLNKKSAMFFEGTISFRRMVRLVTSQTFSSFSALYIEATRDQSRNTSRHKLFMGSYGWSFNSVATNEIYSRFRGESSTLLCTRNNASLLCCFLSVPVFTKDSLHSFPLFRCSVPDMAIRRKHRAVTECAFSVRRINDP